MVMQKEIELVKKYFYLVENFSTDSPAYEAILHPEIVITEFPNLISGKIRQRTLDAMKAGVELGRKMLASQHFSIQHIFKPAPSLIVEVKWTGKMAMDAGQLKKGQELTAYICYIFEFKEGKIFRHRNYDCYEAF
jgi:ketosteroid isomerase-like protein